MISITKIKAITFWLFRLTIGVAGIVAIIQQDWLSVALLALTMFLMFLPSMLERRLQVDYPTESEIILAFFIFGSMYLGEFHAFYTRFWWWDLFLHGLSALIIAEIGFMLVYILNKQKRITLNPLFTALFAFSFTMMIAVFWEIFEYAMDVLFGLNMQKSGLVDTMWDLIMAVIGGFIVSLIGYFYLAGTYSFTRLKKFEKEFIDNNKHLFTKKK